MEKSNLSRFLAGEWFMMDDARHPINYRFVRDDSITGLKDQDVEGYIEYLHVTISKSPAGDTPSVMTAVVTFVTKAYFRWEWEVLGRVVKGFTPLKNLKFQD